MQSEHKAFFTVKVDSKIVLIVEAKNTINAEASASEFLACSKDAIDTQRWFLAECKNNVEYVKSYCKMHEYLFLDCGWTLEKEVKWGHLRRED